MHRFTELAAQQMALLAKVWLQHVFLRYTRHLHKGCATNLPVGLAPSRIAAFAGAALTLFLLGAAVFATLKPERSGGGLPSRHLGNDVTIEFSSNLTGTSLSTPGSPENAVLAAAAATLDTPLDGGSNATAIDGQALVTIPLSPVSKADCVGYGSGTVPPVSPTSRAGLQGRLRLRTALSAMGSARRGRPAAPTALLRSPTHRSCVDCSPLLLHPVRGPAPRQRALGRLCRRLHTQG